MNDITQQIIEEFKLRIKLDGNDEDQNLARILNDSVNDLILKTGEYTIEESGVFKELVFERARYVYNDALEYFDTNFVSQITLLAIANPKVLEGGDGGGSTGPTIITYQDVVNALGYTPLNSSELQNFIARYNDEQAALSMRITNNSTRITTLENQMGNVDLTPINNRIAAVENVNANQTQRIEALESGTGVDLTPINNRITAVENVNNTQNSRLDALEQAPEVDLGPLTTRVQNVEDGLTVTNNDISSLNNRVNTLENGGGQGGQELTELENRVTSTENVNTTQNQRIEALENAPGVDLTPVSNRITAVETVNDTQNDRLDNLTTKVDNVEDANNTHISNNDIHKTSSVIRQEENTPLRTEVVSSLPSSNLNNGRIVFNTADNTFRGYNGSEWV